MFIMRTRTKFLTPLIFLITPILAHSGGTLTGSTKLACEAILCLSTGSPPGECSPSLKRYFSIDLKKFKDTIKERGKFLNLCPSADSSGDMRSLVKAIARGAGRCDAASLNRTQGGGIFACPSSAKPSYCSIYEKHTLTNLGSGARFIPPPPPPSPFGGIGGIGGYGGGSSTFPWAGGGTGNIGGGSGRCGHWVD
jgi:hypothetical protein